MSNIDTQIIKLNDDSFRQISNWLHTGKLLYIHCRKTVNHNGLIIVSARDCYGQEGKDVEVRVDYNLGQISYCSYEYRPVEAA